MSVHLSNSKQKLAGSHRLKGSKDLVRKWVNSKENETVHIDSVHKDKYFSYQ
jgi:hypothetical protein